MEPVERELWMAFAAAEPPEKGKVRQQLMERYLPMVMNIAANYRNRLPDFVELDDLFQDGIFGLSDAVERFDIGRGLAFATYAAPRVKGAIVDGLRNRDWVPRLVRQRQETAVEILSLSRHKFETDSGKDVTEVHVRADPAALPAPLELERREGLRPFLGGMSRTEQLIMRCYYEDDMTMKEIGEAAGLSESRVSQLHSEILLRLKAKLTPPPTNKNGGFMRRRCSGDAELERIEEMRPDEVEPPVGEQSCDDGVPVRTLGDIEIEQQPKLERLHQLQNPNSAAPTEPAKENVMAKVFRGPWILECTERPGERFTLEQACDLAKCAEISLRQSCAPSGNGRCGGYTWKRIREGWMGGQAEAPTPTKKKTRRSKFNPGPADNAESAAEASAAELGLTPKQVAQLMYQLQVGSDQMCTATDMEFLIDWAQKVRSAGNQLADILAGRLQVKVSDGKVLTEAN